MEVFEFEGLQIRYVRVGKGEPMVMIHNGGTSHAIWKKVIPLLSERYEIFALDLLGFGSSTKPKEGFELTNYQRILGAFIDSVTSGPVHLVGNCMGSAMSLGFAMERPQDVRSLVLINPLTDRTFSAGWLGWALWLRKNAPGVSRAVHKVLGKFRVPAFMARQSLAFQFGAIGRSQGMHKADDLCACFTGEGQMYSLLGVLDDLHTYIRFDEFSPPAGYPPIHTIWGNQNRVLSAKAGRKLNESLKPVRSDWLDGCGHLAMLEEPEKIAASIQTFLANTQAPAGEIANR